jgi:hypothetical protein
MSSKALVDDLVMAFNAQGFARIEPDEASIRWADTARLLAEEKFKGLDPKEAGWYDSVLHLPIPRNALLLALINELLVSEPVLPTSAQLSTLVNGFDRENASHHRHVDGYYKSPGKEKEELAWHALLIGVLIVPLPEHGYVGSPVVWPGSHRLTRKALEALGPSPTPERVGEQIWAAPAIGQSMQHLRLHGQAGTIFVLD